MDLTKKIASTMLIYNIKVIRKIAPQGMEDAYKRNILTNLKVSLEKKYLSAKLDGNTLDVDGLLKLQKESWFKKSNTDMLEMYGKMGITEDEIRKIIQETIDSCV